MKASKIAKYTLGRFTDIFSKEYEKANYKAGRPFNYNKNGKTIIVKTSVYAETPNNWDNYKGWENIKTLDYTNFKHEN